MCQCKYGSTDVTGKKLRTDRGGRVSSRRLVVLVFIAALPQHSVATSNPDVIEEVRCTEIAFSLAVENRDKDAFALLLDADARFIGGTVLKGRNAVVEAWAVFMTNGGPKIIWRPQIVEVLETGDLAFSHGPYRVTTLDDQGDTVVEWGTFNSIWRKSKDGHWRIVFDKGNKASKPPRDEIKKLLDEPAGWCAAVG